MKDKLFCLISVIILHCRSVQQIVFFFFSDWKFMHLLIVIMYKRFIDCFDNNEFEHIAIFAYDKATYQLVLYKSWLSLKVKSDGLCAVALFTETQVAYESLALNVLPLNWCVKKDPAVENILSVFVNSL